VIIADLLIFDAVNNEMPHLPFNNGTDFINEFLRIVFKKSDCRKNQIHLWQKRYKD
jgi:hypothetical protein